MPVLATLVGVLSNLSGLMKLTFLHHVSLYHTPLTWLKLQSCILSSLDAWSQLDEQCRIACYHLFDKLMDSPCFGVIQFARFSTLQHMGIVAYFLPATSSVLCSASSFSACWRAVHCSGCFSIRCFWRLLMLYNFVERAQNYSIWVIPKHAHRSS